MMKNKIDKTYIDNLIAIERDYRNDIADLEKSREKLIKETTDNFLNVLKDKIIIIKEPSIYNKKITDTYIGKIQYARLRGGGIVEFFGRVIKCTDWKYHIKKKSKYSSKYLSFIYLGIERLVIYTSGKIIYPDKRYSSFDFLEKADSVKLNKMIDDVLSEKLKKDQPIYRLTDKEGKHVAYQQEESRRNCWLLVDKTKTTTISINKVHEEIYNFLVN